MATDKEIIAIIDAAFMAVEKPEHFTNFAHCEECAEHDELLRNRDRDTLSIEDVGNIGWQPISFSSAQGIAYYMPTLARLALETPTYHYGWYGDTLEIHLTSNEKENGLLAFCTPQQRHAVSALLAHFLESRTALPERMTDDKELQNAIALWSA